ncbi:translation initiation factor eIF-2 alpha subunit [Indivirus ILV1]|uniref:Translation initiation factor eIF-2 alpha subunit n=1 Tax=Indivirus ILV1 TaxID=1977633 RepID=A0A1V0SDL2_9VIRU|nr:translation initiation factor eIF-2 alpha subunit [Indivirus ILV1]
MKITRYFRNELPQTNDIVMVKVVREDEEFGYYCDLLEYDHVEGFLPLSELVKTKYVKKHILKPDQVLPMSVSKIDKTLVNLTKKRLSNEESDSKKEMFRVCNDINKLVNECYIMYQKGSQNPTLDITTFMDHTIWNLYETYDNNYFKIYQIMLHDPLCILPSNIFDNALTKAITNDINKRITYANKIVHLDLKLIVTDENPISIIKQILDLSKIQIPNCKITVLVMTSPIYRIRIEGDFNDYDEVISLIKDQIIQNSNNTKSILDFFDPNIEKEAICKIKYYGDYILANFSFC